MAKFSIVTVVMNDLSGLKKTAESIISQQFLDYEWLVIDGGSRDGAVAYLASLEWPSLTWTSKPDQGIYDAMNKGLLQARGDYVVFLNAGDVFTTANVLEMVAATLDQEGNPDVLFGAAELTFGNGKSLLRLPRVMERYIWHGVPANHQATYYKRRALADLLYDTTYRICGDYFIIAKLFARNVSAAYLFQPLVKFSVGGASYQNRKLLFLEPYRIQRDILKIHFLMRIASLVKRLTSTAMMMLLQELSQIRLPSSSR